MKTKLFFIMFLFMAVTMKAATLRVAATGNNTNGDSWTNAYTTIASALTASAFGDEIWVKQGTYTITAQLNYKSGVNVYGGFAGTETMLVERSTNNSLTIITQSTSAATRLLGGAALTSSSTWDGFTFNGNNFCVGVTLFANSNLNNVTVKNCVVTNNSGAGIFIASSTAAAPVRVTNSTIANNKVTVNGGTLVGGGAGIFVHSSSTSALIENCTISGNNINTTTAGSTIFGAGIFLYEGVIRNSTIDSNTVTGTASNNVTAAGIAIMPLVAERKVLIKGCSITNNTSVTRGGAILIDPRYSGQYLGNYTITETKIINNKSNNVGGGIFSTSVDRQTAGLGWTLNVINCLIANNEATTGAGMNINSSGNVNIIYSTFANNKATASFGGGAIAFAGSTLQTIAATIKNTLLWGNTSGDISGRSQFSNNSQASTISNCAIQDYASAFGEYTNTTRTAILSLNASNSNAAGPNFLSPTTTIGFGITNLSPDGWKLTTGSPCIASGISATDNNAATILTDFAGNARTIANTDLGAFQLNTVTTWTGTSWSNGAPNTNLDAVIVGAYTTAATPGNGLFTAKTVTVNSGSLTVANGTNLTIANEIVNNTTADKVVVESNANLLQSTTAVNMGPITVNRESAPLLRLDYSIWSSPTGESQKLNEFSPLTSSSRFYTYNPLNDTYSTISDAATFSKGKGFLIRMPNTWSDATASSWTGSFIGIPNNGTVTINGLTAAGYNAIGNPYPSTLSADAFITANSIVEALYFWRKTNGATGTAYATYTKVGAVGNPGNGGITPDGTIQVGQGFIIKSPATTVSFTNAMRSSSTTSPFLRTKQPNKDRIWLNLSEGANPVNQMMIAYMDGSTLGIDGGIDGKYINDDPTALTSNIEGGEYVIQGRPAFDPADVVALNFKTVVAGTYTIAKDHADGLFATSQDVYLLDATTGIETNLQTNAYTFNAAAGTNNARFSLKYQKTLGLNVAEFNDNSVKVFRTNGILNVSSGANTISNIQVYDIQGRVLAEQDNVNATSATIKNVRATQQVLLVKVTAADNTVVTKKVIN